MKKKVIISTNVLFTITNFRKELILFLQSNGYQVVCVADLDELSTNSKKILDELKIKFIQVHVDRKGLNPLKDFLYMYRLYKIYKREKPHNVLHFTIKPNIYGTLAAKIARVNSVNTINGLGSGIIKNNWLSFILKLLYRFSLQSSKKVFFQNQDDLEFFITNSLVQKEKVAIVPGSGVDTRKFNHCFSKTKNITFLLVARLLKDKGIYEYIEAVKVIKQKYPDVNFLLGGQFDFGNPTAINEKEINYWKAKKYITFLGQTDDITLFLKKADVIVLPSYREGLSRFLIEAASASKPIITTNVPGCKEIVKDNYNGFLCESKNVQSLTEAIEKIIELNRKQLLEMGNNSREIAINRFDHSIVNKIYLKELL